MHESASDLWTLLHRDGSAIDVGPAEALTIRRSQACKRLRLGLAWEDELLCFARYYQPSSSVLTLRTPLRSYAFIGLMGLGVPDGNDETPGDAQTRGLLVLGTIECMSITNMWPAPLFASKEQRRHAPKAKSKAG